MKVVLAEKPSVAREIAFILGASEKKEGYLTGNGYYVTWALGHLVGLGMPEDYGISGFEKASLPILPKPFLLTEGHTKYRNWYTGHKSSNHRNFIFKKLHSKRKKISDSHRKRNAGL